MVELQPPNRAVESMDPTRRLVTQQATNSTQQLYKDRKNRAKAQRLHDIHPTTSLATTTVKDTMKVYPFMTRHMNTIKCISMVIVSTCTYTNQIHSCNIHAIHPTPTSLQRWHIWEHIPTCTLPTTLCTWLVPIIPQYSPPTIQWQHTIRYHSTRSKPPTTIPAHNPETK